MTEERPNKNSVFGSDTHAEVKQPPRASISFEYPSEEIPLPSRGLTYNGSMLGMASLPMRQMTSKDENILMNKALIKNGTVVTEVLRSVIMNSDQIDFSQLLSGDRQALFLACRIMSYDAEYKPKVQCPACQHPQTHEVDLSTVQIKHLDLNRVQQVAPQTNEFYYTFPKSKIRAKYKYLTVADEEAISKDAEMKKKAGIPVENAVVTNKLVSNLVGIESPTDEGGFMWITDKNKIRRFVEAMPAKDSRAFRTFLDQTEPGMDFTHSFTCVNCEYTEVIGISLDATFFWPTA